MIFAIFAWGLIYGCAATCGVVLAYFICSRLTRLEGGPAPVRLPPAVPIAVFAVLGMFLAARQGQISQLGIVALLGVPFIGAWYSDARTGIIPDVFTLIPLAIVAVGVFLNHTWWVAISGAVVFAAFALAALFSKGRGMGWGDAKLATLAGTVLGLQSSLLALGVACFAATLVSVIRNRGTQPIAFAPYIVVTVLITIGISVHA